MLGHGSVRALGTMSGTSLDGVDAAVIETDGTHLLGFGETAYRAYSGQERAVLTANLGRWACDDVAEAAGVVEDAHAELMAGFADVDIAGFHGQTLAHDPANARTHQCGDGAVLAARLGVPVAWDFRSADVAAGGQGAPFAPFYHFALAKWICAAAPVAFLNLGGVGNITFVDPSFDRPEELGALLAFDTGPANAPLNDLMQTRLGRPYDEGGAVAAEGTPDPMILDTFSRHSYFDVTPPKSLDRDDFAGLVSGVNTLNTQDAAATLTMAIVQSVQAALCHLPVSPARLLITGGGRHNDSLMSWMGKALPCEVLPVEAVGLDGDMLEAQAFAFLAVRAAKGLPLSAPATTGVPAPLTGGRLSLPDAYISPQLPGN